MFYFDPDPWGRFPGWRAYFSNGLKPPTSYSIRALFLRGLNWGGKLPFRFPVTIPESSFRNRSKTDCITWNNPLLKGIVIWIVCRCSSILYSCCVALVLVFMTFHFWWDRDAGICQKRPVILKWPWKRFFAGVKSMPRGG